MADHVHVLDSPVRSALTSGDSQFAVVAGNAVRYRPDVSPFAAFNGPQSSESLSDLSEVASAQNPVILIDAGPLPGWTYLATLQGFQMTSVEVVEPTVSPEHIETLTEADITDMLELTSLSKPGPFAPHTFELGGYIGIRVDGRLVAMAGERMHPPGWAEISAVCTHPDFRGRGYGARLLLTVAAGIRSRGESPFLHVAGDNAGAIRLYRGLGFAPRRETTFTVVHPPAQEQMS